MILAIIQARMSSERLPGKVMLPIGGYPILSWVVQAAENSGLVDEYVVATSTMASDLRICAFCDENDIPYTTGSLDDVLDRFYQTALEFMPTHIVRLTADCPMLTGEIIDKTIRAYFERRVDYAYNEVDGVDVEVFPFASLLVAAKMATSQSDREHVTPYIKRKSRATLLRHYGKSAGSVDTKEDYERIKGEMECSLNQRGCLTVL